jgi:hypothetical protein
VKNRASLSDESDLSDLSDWSDWSDRSDPSHWSTALLACRFGGLPVCHFTISLP